jgi:hypothetical protein
MAMGGPLASGVSYDDVLLTAWQEQAREYLDRTAARLQSDGLRVVTEIVISPLVANTILEVEESEQSRVVAMATHGRGGLSRLFLGGVADKVVRGADCPVLVCPASRIARRAVKRPRRPGASWRRSSRTSRSAVSHPEPREARRGSSHRNGGSAAEIHGGRKNCGEPSTVACTSCVPSQSPP